VPAKFGIIVADLVSRRVALEEAADVGFFCFFPAFMLTFG
jgi:hypothetical protein